MVFIYDITGWSEDIIILFKWCMHYFVVQNRVSNVDLVPDTSLVSDTILFKSKAWFEHFEEVGKQKDIYFKFANYRGTVGILPKEILNIENVEIDKYDFMPIEQVFGWSEKQTKEFEILYSHLMLNNVSKRDIICKVRSFGKFEIFNKENGSLDIFDIWLKGFLVIFLAIFKDYVDSERSFLNGEKSKILEFIKEYKNKLLNFITDKELEKLINLFGSEKYDNLERYNEVLKLKMEMEVLEI